MSGSPRTGSPLLTRIVTCRRLLSAWLDRPDVTDILINAPGAVWVETIGGEMQRFEAPELTDTALWRLAGQVAAATHQGGTSTGKTTFLNALVKEIPVRERLIVIEDTPEIRLHHPNAVGMIAARGSLGEARVNVEDLLQASLRMRPDRIILGELRGPEAYSFLRAVNSGHPGSITTVHADSPRAAVDQIALMVMQAGANLSRGEIVDYVGGVVDVAVQLLRREGRRAVSEIAFRPASAADRPPRRAVTNDPGADHRSKTQAKAGR